MRLIRQSLPVFLLAGLPLFSASKEIVQLQRDVSLLQEAVRLLQRSLDEKMTELKVLVGQSLEESKRSATAVQVLDSAIQTRMREQEKSVAAPVAGVSVKIDQLANDFSTLKESVVDQNARLQKMLSAINDLKVIVQTMQTPVKPPEPQTGGGSAAPPPGASAQAILEDAKRDISGGRLDLALNQLQDLLKWFPNSELAPEAQYQVGQVHYIRTELDLAIEAWDQLLEKYPDNPRTPDGLYMKGMALMRTGRKTDAAAMFREVANKYPNSDVGPKAKNQLKAMGMSAAPAASAKKSKRTRD